MNTTRTAGRTEADILAELRAMELDTLTRYTLSDAIREGCQVTDQAHNGWGSGGMACALSAARLAARARGYVK